MDRESESSYSHAFRQRFLLLVSGGMGAVAVAVAVAGFVAGSEGWTVPLLGLVIAAAAGLLGFRGQVSLGAAILVCGFALILGVAPLAGWGPPLSSAAKLGLLPLVALVAVVGGWRQTAAFAALLVALVFAASLAGGTEDTAAALAAGGAEALAVAVFGALTLLWTRQSAQLDAVMAQASRIATGDLETPDHAAAPVQDMVQGLRKLVDQVQSGVQILGSATGQIAAMSTEQERGAVHQASAVAEIRRTVESLAEASRRIADSARGVLDNAERTLENSKLASERLHELTHHTSRIHELLEFIKEVANKSEVLALNAALEGSRAGEAGRGFSLVAAQMQRLAESTTQTVQRVKPLVENISSTTDGTVLSMEQTTTLAASTTKAAREISLITEQQGSSAAQVAEAMKDIALITSEFAGGIKDTLSAIDEIDRLAHRLNEVAHFFTLPSEPAEPAG